MKTTLIIFSTLMSVSAYAQLQSCGEVKYNPELGCAKKAFEFNVSACEKNGVESQIASYVTCGKNEITANLKGATKNYRVVFEFKSNQWTQKGKVWSFQKKETGAAVVAKPEMEIKLKPAHGGSAVPQDKEKPKPEISEQKLELPEIKPADLPAPTQATEIGKGNESETHPASTAATEAAKPEVPMVTAAKEASSAVHQNASSWDIKLNGWMTAEYESLKNFGDQLSSASNVFNSNDANSTFSNLNALANFGFSAEKASHKFVTLFEVGEVYFGESTTGGTQGLRGKNVETRNLYVEEQVNDKTSVLVGLYSLSSDPHAFILTDHYAGFKITRKNENHTTSFWMARAADGKPTATATKDQYLGFIHNKQISDDSAWNLFGVYRGTRETFVDSVDLTTEYTAKSEYYWLGLQGNHRNTSGFGFDASAILSNAKFKAENAADGAGGSDSTNAWLAHLMLDQQFQSGWTLFVQELMTPGSNDSRTSSDKRILSRRKSFASPNPSSAYLLTVATNDGGDDGAGSLRGGDRVIGRLDLDEGLQISMLGFKKQLGEKFEVLGRYAMLKTAVAKSTTNSADYGTEYDVVLTYKFDEYAQFVTEYGVFKPGGFFANKDEANLLSVRYKLVF